MIKRLKAKLRARGILYIVDKGEQDKTPGGDSRTKAVAAELVAVSEKAITWQGGATPPRPSHSVTLTLSEL